MTERRWWAKRLGEAIKTARLQQDWTQDTLSTRSGVSVSYISEIEHGTGGLPVDTLMALALALDLDLATVIGDLVVTLRALEGHRRGRVTSSHRQRRVIQARAQGGPPPRAMLQRAPGSLSATVPLA